MGLLLIIEKPAKAGLVKKVVPIISTTAAWRSRATPLAPLVRHEIDQLGGATDMMVGLQRQHGDAGLQPATAVQRAMALDVQRPGPHFHVAQPFLGLADRAATNAVEHQLVP